MLSILWYLLKVIICSGILFGYYWFFLRNKIFHRYNRFYLLATMLLSMVLPLLKINFWQPAAQQSQAIRVLRAVSYGDEYMTNFVVTAQKSNWSWEQIYTLIYLIVSAVLFFVLIRTLFLIRTLLKKYPVQQVEQVAFVNTDDKSTPFSFLKYIFWNSSIDVNTVTGRQIFKHEVAHIQEKHTYDKLFVNIVLIFCWCNPFFWLYRKELNMIHEFIADKKAVEDSDTSAFAAMILQAAYPKHRFELTNNFFYSPIKRRLLMLTKIDNPRLSYIARLMVLPLAVLIFAAFTFKAKTNGHLYNGKKITVVIDAGHGGKDLGASSVNGTTFEKDLTLAIAKKVKEINSNDAIEIILTRDDDVYMSPKEKAEFANSKNADLFISFHVDNGPPASVNKHSGISFWVSRDEFPNTASSKTLASALLNEFSSNYGLPVISPINQRQVGVWVLQGNICPAVIIETGFINNDKDLAYLKTTESKETIAKNVLAGIEKYLQSKPDMKMVTDTIPSSIFVNTSHADANYLKSKEFKSQALVIVDSREIGNVGNDYIEKATEKYSTCVIYNPTEASKIYGTKGKYGVIKLTVKDVEYISANSINYDAKSGLIKLSGAGSSIKGDFSNSLIYLEHKIISPEKLNSIPPEKISSITVLKGDKLNDIVDAKGKTSVIYVSLKADDLREIVVISSANSDKNRANISLVNFDALYIGLNNLVSIEVPDLANDNLLVTIDQGVISGKNGKYNVQVSHLGNATIEVSTIKNNKRVTIISKSFKVRRVPDPTDPDFPEELKEKLKPFGRHTDASVKLYLGNYGGGTISVDELKAQKEFRVSPDYQLLSGSVYISHPENSNVTVIRFNSELSNACKDALAKCTVGSTLIFDNVLVRDRDGNTQTILNPPGFSVTNMSSSDSRKSAHYTDDVKATKDYTITDQRMTEEEITNSKFDLAQDNNKIFTRTETPPLFAGGDEAWRKYLMANLKPATPLDEGWKAGKYTIMVKFIVARDGTVSEVIAENYKGSKTAEHCVGLIIKAPKWVPAMQNSRVVNAVKRQPFTFVIED